MYQNAITLQLLQALQAHGGQVHSSGCVPSSATGQLQNQFVHSLVKQLQSRFFDLTRVS